MLAVSIGTADTAGALKAMASAARRGADVIEVRLDFMREFDLPRLLRDRPLPVIVTNRPVREGGRFAGNESDRIAPLLAAIDLGVEYVDVEIDSVGLIPNRGATDLIVSIHDFKAMPDDPARLRDRLAASGASVAKLAGMARAPSDAVRVLEAYRRAPLPTVAIAMGEHGLASRLLCLRYETCFLTYAALDAEEAVAPGQIALEAMLGVFRCREIGPLTAAYGIVSPEPPEMAVVAETNRLLRDAGLDAVAVPIRLRLDDSKTFELLAEEVFQGFWASGGTFEAAAIEGSTYASGGAVGVLVRSGNGLRGFTAGGPTEAVAAWAAAPRPVESGGLPPLSKPGASPRTPRG